eukprot:2468010-Pleurochrysis_carterae.AAC.1
MARCGLYAFTLLRLHAPAVLLSVADVWSAGCVLAELLLGVFTRLPNPPSFLAQSSSTLMHFRACIIGPCPYLDGVLACKPSDCSLRGSAYANSRMRLPHILTRSLEARSQEPRRSRARITSM